MLNHRLKIVLSMFLSFVLVQGIMYFSENPDTLQVQAENIKGLLSQIKFDASSITRMMTLNIGPTEQNYPQGWSDQGENSLNLPSISNPTIQPLPQTNPTQFINEPTDTIPKPSYSTPTKAPTKPPTRQPTKIPTSTPKPTKVPKPTPTPKPAPIATDVRPGSSMAEIFQEVGKRACIPAALLRAFQTQESGPFFNYNSSSSTIKIYNTYGWWITGTGDPCFGLGYHTQTGIVPQDSVSAGIRCRNALGGYDQGIMGILQISQEEQDAARKYTTGILTKNYDRRVLFDNALIFAIITKNRLGDPPTNCYDWPDDAIKTAAEKHYGSCGDDYCTNILKYYKQYR